MKLGQLVCAVVVVLLSMTSAHSAEPVSKSRWKGIAIGGHDTAAYHDLKRDPQEVAVKGVKSFVVVHKGATWRFLTKQSSEKFAADPERYTPAYNGHCANALSLGEGLVKTDGTHWEIFDDKLHLFYAPQGRTRWLDGNWQTYKLTADAAWEKLK